MLEPARLRTARSANDAELSAGTLMVDRPLAVVAAHAKNTHRNKLYRPPSSKKRPKAPTNVQAASHASTQYKYGKFLAVLRRDDAHTIIQCRGCPTRLTPTAHAHTNVRVHEKACT
jgi:hypothetical protein